MQTQDHPVFATVYSIVSHHLDSRLFGTIRSDLLRNQSGRILEIGAGSGANIPYFDANAQVTLTEPDSFMLQHLREKVQQSTRQFELVQAAAESLPFPSESFDTVLATLVFCSVKEPAVALAEIKRVLKPQGQLLFLEHVVASEAWKSRLQSCITPVWSRLAGGCHLNRDTMKSLQEAGFHITEYKNIRLPGTGLLPLVLGRASLSDPAFRQESHIE